MRTRAKPVHSAARVLVGWLYALAVLLVIGAGVVWVIDSPYFPIKHITITTADNGAFRRITRDELIAAKNDSIAGNIFKVNLNRVKKRFEQIDWIEQAQVSRIWPDTVAIRISERVPVAYWNDVNIVDENGKIFTAQLAEPLPHFYGPSASERTMVETYAQIAPLLAGAQLQLKRLIYSDRFAWQLELSNGITVKLGREDTVARVARFAEYWQTVLKPQETQLLYVDMRYQKGFAIKLKDGANPPAQAN